MLPELILREEQEENYTLLAGLGFASVLFAFAVSGFLFPSQADLLVVIFAAIPLVYPLVSFFFDDEKSYAPHTPEALNYFSLFFGQVLAFLILGYFRPEFFAVQSQAAGISGNAVDPGFFLGLSLNNMTVFVSIAFVSFITGSAGAFILSWNASVLGVFLASLLLRLPRNVSAYLLGDGKTAPPLAYVPHATFEMSGFILAGISGTLMSAAFYRKHFDKKHWKDFGKLFVAGVLLILIGAFLEAT
jgi:uncharacterized membrane protein SpoIIM required for sporulation